MLVHPDAPRVVSPAAVGDEILEHLAGLARKRRLDLGVLLPTVASLPVEWIEPDSYGPHENAARRLIKERDEDDWPVVAVALELESKRKSFAIWTQDKDFEVSRLPTLTTGQLLDHLEGRGAR